MAKEMRTKLTELSRDLHTAVSILQCLQYDADISAATNVTTVTGKLPAGLAWRWGEHTVDLGIARPTVGGVLPFRGWPTGTGASVCVCPLRLSSLRLLSPSLSRRPSPSLTRSDCICFDGAINQRKHIGHGLRKGVSEKGRGVGPQIH